MADKQLLALTNLTVTRQADGKVSITFDPKQTQGRSESGKSDIIATTRGNVIVEDFTIGLNVYRKVK